MSNPKTDGFAESLGSLSDIFKKRSDAANASGSGSDEFQHIYIDDVIEDPDQPRTEFDPAFIEELSINIKNRGVKTPISVKPKNADGKYIINYGANRYRASILAGKKTIPATIDDDVNPYDQVNENVKRKRLSTYDLAKWIKRRLDAGDDRKTVAEGLEQPLSFITEHLAVLKLPDNLLDSLYKTGLVKESRLLYEIGLCYKTDKEKTEMFCSQIEENGGSTLVEIKAFKQSLKDSKQSSVNAAPGATDDPGKNPQAGLDNKEGDNTTPASSDADEDEEQVAPVSKPKTKAADIVKTLNKPVISVLYDESVYRLLYMTAAKQHHVWIESHNDEKHEVPAKDVTIVDISESD
jgi:ParB family chromosome partitioning protein